MTTSRPTPPTFTRGHAARDSELAEYFRSIRGIALLTPEEELDAVTRLRQTGCEQSRERLVCGNLRLAVYIAKRYAHLGVPLQDLVEAANVGLLMAVDRYDPAKGARFATYAQWWIRRCIFTTLSEQGRLIRLPPDAQKAARLCREVAEQLRARLGRAATPQELAQETGMPETAALPMSAAATVSLSTPAAEEEDPIEVSDERVEGVDSRAVRDERQQLVRSVLHKIPAPEREVVAMHYGLDGEEPQTIRSIARWMQVTEQRVKHLLRVALSRMAYLLDPAGRLGEPAALDA